MELALSLGDTCELPTKRLSNILDMKNKTTTSSSSSDRCRRHHHHNHTHHVQLDLLLPSSFPLPSQTSALPPQQHQQQLSFSLLTHKLSGGLGFSKYKSIGNKKSPAPPYLERLVLERCGSVRGRASSRANDEDEDEEEEKMNGIRKKLRLTKDQSAFLEDSFKYHNTLNPKQKLTLAKQLKLRPRQVEVWFQNRRARTKLKQTEVDCKYLKRCCEKLTEENRKLKKEVHELRALKQSSSQPFYMQLPPTTLTMCPSCERTTTATASSSSNTAIMQTPFAATTMVFLEAKPIRAIPFSPNLTS